MEKREKFSYTRLLRTAREQNDEMVEYWAEKIVLECLRIDKPLNKLKICVEGITFTEGVKELHHSRNLALANLLGKKGLNVFVYDELFRRDELEQMGLRQIKHDEADLVFNCFELKMRSSV
ncbi:MAG: hypothetical protein KAT65_00695 [Methanophagales archaeon]|nr:hypothetical protein [Methanophagales archaeon]